MEVLLKKPIAVKEEKRSEIHENQDGGQGDFPKLASHETPKQNGNLSKSPSPKRKASPISNQEDNSNSSDRSSTKRPSIPSPLNATGMNCKNQEEQLDSTRAEMGEVRQENERLRMVLSRILKDYQSLQMQFLRIAQQEDKSNNMALTTPPISNQEITSMDEDNEESELVFLSLGTSSSAQKNSKEEKPNNTTSSGAGKSLMDVEEIKMLSGGLTLGLGCKFEVSSTSAIGTQQQRSTANQSTEDSFEDATKEEEEEGGAVGEQWPPSKVLKTMRSGAGGIEDEVSQQAHVKKARVSVRARCDAPTMNDGCQWRKYGQKISKGNPCPRAYYRCTVAPACPVRKQVQRCADDMSILITTYEGTHNHPLPMAATPMASTTAAAASMLLSGSSSSSPSAHLGITSPLTTISSTLNTSSLRGLSFNLSDSSRPRPYYLPSTPSMSTSPSYPTITLDLTSPSPSTNQFNRFSSNLASSIPRYSNNLNFGPDSTAVGSWNASSGYLGYGSQLFNNKREIVGGSSAATPSPFYQSSYPLKSVTPTTPTNGATAASPAAPTQQALTDTLAKAITSDPSFQSALAAAITSIVGGSGGNNGSSTSQTVAEAVAQSLKLVGGDHGVQYFPSAAVTATANGSGSGSGCATSFLNRPPPAAASHPGSLMFLQPSLGFSNPKSSSSSPVENSEHIN